jgi:hypothetical protein
VGALAFVLGLGGAFGLVPASAAVLALGFAAGVDRAAVADFVAGLAGATLTSHQVIAPSAARSISICASTR